MIVEQRVLSKKPPATPGNAAAGAGRRGRGLFTPNPKLKLQEQVHEVMRFFHYSPRTEEVYWHWMRRFMTFWRDRSHLIAPRGRKSTPHPGPLPGRGGEGGASRHNRKESERFKSFTYEELTKRDKVNLDIFWLKDDALEESANLPAPEIIAQEITDDLEAALEQFATITEDLK